MAAMKRNELPPGFVLRHPRPEDAEGILAVMKAVDLEDVGEEDSSLEDVLETWNFPRFLKDRDAWLIEGPERAIVAYGWAWDRKPHLEIVADSYVLPQVAGTGVEEVLFDRIEERGAEHLAAAPRSEEVVLRLFTSPKAETRIESLRKRGYEHIRTYSRMTITLDSQLAPPHWPEGISARPYQPSDALGVERAMQEAFSDHFGYSHEPHEEWARRRLEHPSFDPTLWIVAWDGTEVAGAAINYPFENDGWVRELGVRPPWRGRGLGRALLLESFALFAARGMTSAGLGVDAANTTGATQLYESAGMRVAFRHDLYEKRLGAGRGA